MLGTAEPWGANDVHIERAVYTRSHSEAEEDWGGNRGVLILSLIELYIGHMPEELEIGVVRQPWVFDFAAIFLGQLW